MTEHDAIRQEIREAHDRIDSGNDKTDDLTSRIAKLEDLLDWDHRIGLAFSKQHDNMKKHQMLDMERFNDNLTAQTERINELREKVNRMDSESNILNEAGDTELASALKRMEKLARRADAHDRIIVELLDRIKELEA